MMSRNMAEEDSKNPDHRRLGRELDLFVFSDLVGSGLPLWTPRGTLVRDLLDDFVWQLRKKRGYQKVQIPHITKKELYETSGHWDKFKDDLFRITTREGHDFALKPMNCPHHIQIFARRPHSYREMPQRFCETTMMYRDEQSGELNGLSRVRAITIDDAHVFCRESQVKEEFLKVWDIIEEFYNAFGFSLQVRLSFHDPKQPEKYLGDKKLWKFAESILREIAEEKKANTIDGIGEAAFYGPKLDFMAKDSLGREWQVATIQLDMNMPERFDLTCINEKGERERIVMVHYAVMGSIERFLSVILEHLEGRLPLWLAPVQAKILPISDKHASYAEEIARVLGEAGLRVEIDSSNETLGKKIRNGKSEKIPYLLVVGDEEVSAKTAAVESRDKGKVGALPLPDVLARLQEEIRSRA
ncbi:threonine--tRNA ligase [Candidatus Parcubacteria bacterium]|nr:MAG: threonine--tRNA ligase [Candidatus Parcubacteria bacterium]